MSFGFAVGDFIAAGQLAWDLYHKCYLVIQDAPREFRDLVDSLHSVRIAMQDLEDEVKSENSALSRAGEDRVRNVVAMVGAITRTLKAVEKIVDRYQTMVGTAGDFKSYGLRLWSKIKWTQEVKVIEDLKQKLMFHTSTITLVLLTVGNASLSRIETIMQTLVNPIPPQTNATAIATGSVDLHPVSHKLPLDRNNEDISEVQGSNSLQELSGDDRYLPPELASNDRYPAYLSDQTTIHELDITAEETVAVKEILAEAEQKFIKHGRPAPSRRNTVKETPLVKISINRKPIPNSRNRQNSHDQATSSAWASINKHPERVNAPSLNISSGLPPVPAKIPHDYPPIATQNEKHSDTGTLATSIIYRPSLAIEKAFLSYAGTYSSTKRWPTDFRSWLQIAEWWFLKGQLSSREHGGLIDQAYIEFSKCSWILSDILGENNNFSYEMYGNDSSDYYHLLKKLETNYIQQNPDTLIPTGNLDSYTVNLKNFEPKQPEEESGIFVSPHHQDLDIFNHETREHEQVIFQSFIALEFGLCRPSQPSHEMARSYLLTLYFNRSSLTSWIYICNQTRSLGIVRSIDRRNVGPQLDGSNISDWIDLEFNGQVIYAGFSSAEAAVPYAIEYNSIRRELLEMPTCISEITVEEARYMPRGHGVNPIGVGPAPLALMEMMKAEDEQSRYRELVMRGHFTTKEIPLHVIKILQSRNSPIRVQLWWPTFDIPREDLRDYLRWPLGMAVVRKYNKTEFYFNPHIRSSVNLMNIAGTWNFVEIRYRSIDERLLDIDLKVRSEFKRMADRMLDVIFKTPEDAAEFIRHTGGTAPQVTERLVFQKITYDKEIRLFRGAGLDSAIRLSYKESDVYCSFIVDRFSTYKITPEGSVSLWSIMWSPFGNPLRNNYSYLTDSIDLGLFNTLERDDFITHLVFPEQQVRCASMGIASFTGVRAGVIGKFAKAISSLRSSAEEAMLVLRMFGDHLEVMVFGKIRYTECNKSGEHLRLTANVLTYSEKKLDQPKGAHPKLSVRLSVTGAQLHSFNRERSIMKPARAPKLVSAEIGGLSFVVNDISEWRAAVTRLQTEHMTSQN